MTTPAIPPNAHCIGCGYPLRALPQPRCPECGRSFIPGNWRTFVAGRPLNRLERVVSAPPGWVMIPATMCAAVALLEGSTYPLELGPAGFVGILAFLLIGGIWSGRALLALAVVAAHGWRRVALGVMSTWKRWTAVPLIAFVAVVVAASGLLTPIRFRLARPVLDRFAEDVLELPPGSSIPQPSFVGGYGVDGVERSSHADLGTGYVTLTLNVGFDPVTLWYFPDAAPADVLDLSWPSVERLGGAWYCSYDY